MTDAVLAALITTAGAIVVALITFAGTMAGRPGAGNVAPAATGVTTTRRRRGAVLAGVLALAVLTGGAVWYVVSDGTEARLWRALPELPDHRKQIYASAGFGFVYPRKWDLEDYAFTFGGGGEVALVRDRDGEFETQSIRFSLVDIPEHHWHDAQTEFVHFREQLNRRCQLPWREEVKTIGNGRQATAFTCRRKIATGGKTFLVDETTYWHQLAKCVRLRADVRSELHDNAARRAFDAEQAQILQYLRFDDLKLVSNTRRAQCDSPRRTAQRGGDVTDSASQPSVPSSSRTKYHWLALPSTVTRVFLGSTLTSFAEASPRSRRFARGTETMSGALST